VGNLDYKPFTERRRPHVHVLDRTLFLTYRLAGSIPKSTVRLYKARKEWLDDQVARARKAAVGTEHAELKHWLESVESFQREWFVKFEDILHRGTAGPMWMKDFRIADAVSESLRKLDGTAYRLDAYCVMSNHVHAVFRPFLSERDLNETRDETGHLAFSSEQPSLSRIMQALKGSSARECNLLLSRTGQFWEQESFDHVIRPGKLDATIRYVLNNPVKAGLVADWREWRWNYCRDELSDKL
jgi:putative transposase